MAWGVYKSNEGILNSIPFRLGSLFNIVRDYVALIMCNKCFILFYYFLFIIIFFWQEKRALSSVGYHLRRN